ncbi:MAG: hypothetical protein H8M99_06055 [Gloeobacteraceae cyanobacterium ES-bin-144]|nr:hypothetical protein [Verrucomicrobiales bacterium]
MNISEFLNAGTPEERNQYVLTPIETAPQMALYYSLNPIAKIDPSTLNPDATAVLHFPETTAIAAVWSGQDGRKIESVFRLENDEWKLDWKHFAQYSAYPWPLFLAGSGPAEGEFRLLARERLAVELRSNETISIVLYAPHFGNPETTGYQSPEFVIPRKNEDGKLLETAFKLEKIGKQPFNPDLPNLAPEEMIRVRVNVRRYETDSERKFEITKVIACHWYSIDAPGMDTAIPVPEKTQAR